LADLDMGLAQIPIDRPAPIRNNDADNHPDVENPMSRSANQQK